MPDLFALRRANAASPAGRIRFSFVSTATRAMLIELHVLPLRAA